MAKSNQKAYVNWNQKDLMLAVENATIERIDKLALEVLAESQEPIDTGYLAASAYVNSSSGLNTFDEIWETGEYLSRHTGKMEWRDHVDSPEPPPRGGAVAGWAADYAIYVEERTNFIFNALQRVASRHGSR